MSRQSKAPAVEDRLVALLRERAERAIDEFGAAWAAEQLDISVSGVETLRWRKHWSVEKAVHVASCLGVLTEADLDVLVSARAC
jgi:hypothetical protein